MIDEMYIEGTGHSYASPIMQPPPLLCLGYCASLEPYGSTTVPLQLLPVAQSQQASKIPLKSLKGQFRTIEEIC